MFPSSQKKQPLPRGKQPPAAAIAGTSLSRPRSTRPEAPQTAAVPQKLQEVKVPERGDDPQITICVQDDVHNIKKEFRCPKSVLVSQMKYFESHLESCSEVSELEISVHCDASIFEWLMKYMLDAAKPRLEVSKVVSILVSAEYLKMRDLVTECVAFIRDNLNAVAKLPIDMSCISNNVIKQLARLCTAVQIDSIVDPKDRLQSKLFTKKLEELVSDENVTLQRCVYCNQLFTTEQHDWMVCEKAKYFIDFHGKVIAEHVPDPNWSLNTFLTFMKEKGLSWREIYWRVWGRLVSFHCSVCKTKFVGADLSHCSYHPQSARFTYGNNIGHFQCCQQEAIRFDTAIQRKGCSAKDHVVKDHSPQYELLLTKYSMAQEPFTHLDGYLSINMLLQMYYKHEDDGYESEDEPEPIKVALTPTPTLRTGKSKVNPAKQRAWKLDKLRMDDLLLMQQFTREITQHRRKLDPKARQRRN